MIVNFSNEPVNYDNWSTIFLAGPTLRNSDYATQSWRAEAVEILKALGFDGTVYIPEFTDLESMKDFDEEKQTRWEWEALANSSVIVFWVPRNNTDLPGFTTNIEFGRYITMCPEKVVLGYPENATKMKYMDMLYTNVTGKTAKSTLEDTLKEAVNSPTLF